MRNLRSRTHGCWRHITDVISVADITAGLHHTAALHTGDVKAFGRFDVELKPKLGKQGITSACSISAPMCRVG